MDSHLSKEGHLSLPGETARRVLHWAPVALGMALFALSVAFMHMMLAEVTFADISGGFWSASWRALALCLAFTCLSYLVLMAYDVLALRSISKKLRSSDAAFVGFIASAMSQTLGFGALIGGAVRFRIYGSLGLSAAEIGRIVVIAGLSFWLGLAAVAALSMIAEPDFLAGMLAAPRIVVSLLGAGLAGWLRPI